MEPYYADEHVTLYLGDMREVLGALGPVIYDAVIADPPYGQTSLEWDRWPTGWVKAIGEVVPDSCPLWCFGSFRMFLDHAAEFDGWHLAQDLVWEKHNGSNFHADRFKRVHEHVLQWYRGRWDDVWRSVQTTPDATKRAVRRKERPPHTGEIPDSSYRSEDGGPRLQRSVLQVRSCHGYAVHPTQKPVGILEPLLRYSVPPGGLVLDPMAGAGSTLVAAKVAGVRAVGVEARADYCEAAAARLSQGALALG